jgi:hypothetical protein
VKTTEQYFESFLRAGFLKACSWTPSAGGATVLTNVRFKSPDIEVAIGTAQTPDYTISFPASYLPGLKEGETLTISNVTINGAIVASVNFKVRRAPEQLLDGTEMRAVLRKL